MSRCPTIAQATIRRVWLDGRLTSHQAAAAVGLSRAALWNRAKALGLPARASGRRKVITDPEFAAMWQARVLDTAISAYFGAHRDTVPKTAARLGLAKRPRGPRLSLAEYQAHRRIEAMKQQARLEEDQLWNAEMMDGQRRAAA